MKREPIDDGIDDSDTACAKTGICEPFLRSGDEYGEWDILWCSQCGREYPKPSKD